MDKSIREHTRFIEDIQKVTPLVTAHTIHGYGTVHYASIKQGGHFYRGSWQCTNGCKTAGTK